jgi:hypothetical protein
MPEPTKVDDKQTPDPSTQDPNAGGQANASGTPDPIQTGAEGKIEGIDVNVDDTPKTVPLTALHEEREKRQAIQAQLDQIKAMMGENIVYDANGKPIPMPQQQQAQPQDNVREQLDRMWEEDPRKAMQAEMQMALEWYDNVNAQVDIQETEIRNKYKDFDAFRNDVKNYIRRLPPAQRAKPGIMEMAYHVVRGQNVDKILQAREAELLKKYKAGESVQGLSGTYSNPPATNGTVVTDDQKKVAEAMGMSVDDYIKWVKK